MKAVVTRVVTDRHTHKPNTITFTQSVKYQLYVIKAALTRAFPYALYCTMGSVYIRN